MLIIVLLTMTCIFYETHLGECRFSIRGTRCGLSPLRSVVFDFFPTLTMFSVWLMVFMAENHIVWSSEMTKEGLLRILST